MKKIVSVITMVLVVAFASAQQGGVFIKGGLNIANVSTNANGSVNDAHSLPSFHVGILGDLPFSRFVSIQPSLLFTGKGAKIQNGQSGDVDYFKATSHPYYLELPVNLVFKIPLAMKESNVFIGAGPYLAMGIAGKNKVEGTAFSGEESIKWSNDDPTTFNQQEGAGFGVLRRFDYGVDGTVGIQLDKLLLSLNYDHGLAKLQSNDNSNSDNKNQNRVWSISLGFKL